MIPRSSPPALPPSLVDSDLTRSPSALVLPVALTGLTGLGLLAPAAARAGTCTAWEEPQLLAECECEDLDESSGIAWSRTRPGVWFSHNDAGGLPELQAFSLDGTHLESHIVAGAGFRDWEDMAAGPCPEGVEAEHCLYIGDVGDNGAVRETVEVYAVVEPAEGELAQVVATWTLTWPERPRDCEALAVHPCTGRVYLFSKERDPEQMPKVARLPALPDADNVQELEVLAEIDTTALGTEGMLTGADWSPTGDRLVVRNYAMAFAWETDPAEPDAHWSSTPVEVPIDVDGQGETVAWHPDGGLLTTTERVPMRIAYTACAESVEAEGCPGGGADGTGTGGADSGGTDTGGAGAGGETAGGESSADGGSGSGSDGGAGTRLPTSEPSGGCGCSGGGAGALVLLLPLGLVRRRRG